VRIERHAPNGRRRGLLLFAFAAPHGGANSGPQGAGAGPCGAQRLPQQRRKRTRQQLEIAGQAAGALQRPLAGIVETRLRADERRHVPQPRHAVHHRVVQLRHHREAIVRETLDDDHLPQGPAAVEGSLVDLGGQRGDFPRSAGAGHGRTTHVKVDVEIRILDPQGPGQPEGHLEQPPP